MNLVSSKIKTTIESEIKKLKAIIKTLKEDAKAYGRNHEVQIRELEASITNYESFLSASNRVEC